MSADNVHQLCLNIINFPAIMTRKGDVSFYTLLKESGYSEVHDQVTIEAIRKALLEHPENLNDWLLYSENQRCDPVWYFQQSGVDYEVGYWSSKTGNLPPTKFSDRFEACATFIKHLIERVRQIP